MPMTMEEKQELKTSFKEVVNESVQPLKDEVKSIKEETEKNQKAVIERVSKLEALPLTPQKVRAADVGKKLYGYKISKMGAQWRSPELGGKSLRQIVADDPGRFDSFSDDESFEKYCEYMLHFIQARCGKNPEAQQKLFELQKSSYAEGAAGTGGDLVPTEYQWDMIQLARELTMGLRECTVVPMSGDTLTLPKEATMVTVAWKDEAEAAAAGEGTVDNVTLTAKKLTALATASNELIGDSAIDLVGMLTQQFSYAVLLELDNQILAGTGSPVSGLMKGTVATANSLVLGTGSANFSMIIADNFSECISKLSEGYLSNAKWVFGKNVKHFLRILKESTGGFIFQNPSQGLPGTVWEYPYIVHSKCPTTAASTVAALFGNLRYFYVGRRLGAMTLELDPYGKFAEYQTRFRIVTRWGLALAMSDAFATIKTSSS